jgi:S1-C subfamily serine protease
MSLDDDDADDGAAPRPPLPPDDRLWRHPSELGLHGTAASTALVDAPRSGARGSAWTVVLAAGVAGAVLAAGLLALSGHISERIVERPVVEKVAVTPIVSAPTIRGDSASGVAEIVRRLDPAVARLELSSPSGGTTGSGVVFRDDGMVLTSAHLVDEATKVGVRLSDGRRFAGRLVGLDLLTDVAVIDIDATDLPVAVLGTAKGLEVGALAVAVGARQSAGTGPAATTGVISDLRHTLGTSGGAALHGLLQTDAPIAATTSGGPLVDTAGCVIGIVTAFDGDDSGEATRFGFATPIDLAHRVALQLIDEGRARHGWLGIEGTDLSDDDAAAIGVDGGAKVREVDRGSPADRAGIGSDDVITEVDGRPVESMPGLAVEMREHEPGDDVTVGYWRDGDHRETTVRVGERP